MTAPTVLARAQSRSPNSARDERSDDARGAQDHRQGPRLVAEEFAGPDVGGGGDQAGGDEGGLRSARDSAGREGCKCVQRDSKEDTAGTDGGDADAGNERDEPEDGEQKRV